MTDLIPVGTTYVANSANDGGVATDESDPLDGNIDSVNWDFGGTLPGSPGAKGSGSAPAACTGLTTTVVADADTYVDSGTRLETLAPRAR